MLSPKSNKDLARNVKVYKTAALKRGLCVTSRPFADLDLPARMRVL
jgi:hypothetical protein